MSQYLLIEGLKMEGNLGRVKEDSTKEEIFAEFRKRVKGCQENMMRFEKALQA